MPYQPRYIYNRPPGYEGDMIAVQVNLTGKELDLIAVDGEYRTEAVQAAYVPFAAAKAKVEAAQRALLDAAQDSDPDGDRSERIDALNAELAEFTAELEAANAALEAAAADQLARRGELLARAFGNRAYDLDGIPLDFTSGEAALKTMDMDNPDMPRDVVAWLGMAIAQALDWDRENISKNSAATWTTGTTKSVRSSR